MSIPSLLLLCAYDGRYYPHSRLFRTLEGQSDPSPVNPPTLEPMEVAIHKAHEIQQITQNTSLTIASDGILCKKPSLTV